MTRLILALLLGFSMLVSFSVQADNRNGHYNKHHNGHYNKHHNGHYKKHHGHHYYSHNDRRYRCRHDSHYRNGEYAQYYSAPRVSLNATYGYPNSGAVIVYQSHPRGNRDY